MSKFIPVQLNKLFKDSPEPFIATQGSVAFDLGAHRIVNVTERTGDKPATMVIGSGLQFKFDPGFQLKVYSRSGHGFNHGIRLANSTGIIDQDYEGELMIKLVRDFNDPQSVEAWNVLVDEIRAGKQPRVAQAQIQDAYRPLFLNPPAGAEQLVQEAAPEIEPEQKAPARTRRGGLGSTGNTKAQALATAEHKKATTNA